MSRALLLLAVISLVGAGCVTVPDAATVEPPAGGSSLGAFVPDAPAFDFARIVDPDHANHQVPHLHTEGHGLDLAGHTSLARVLPPGVSGSITAIDVHDGYALVAGYQGDLAFAIVDITDPADPKAVSAFLGAGNSRTARFSDDGNYVFYGCETPTTPLPVRGTCEDRNAIHPPGARSGVVAADVTDKRAPKFVAFLPTPGSHNLYATSVDGVDYVFTAATTILRFDRAAGTLEQVAEVPGQHDATVARHPLTGDLLLFTGTNQLAIYDVDDPGSPTLVYEAPDEADWVGWHDQVLVPGLVDGRAILLVGGEYFGGPEMGFVSVLDVTDPAKPVKLGEWRPPFGPRVPWTSYLFSIHEMAATPTGQVAVAWNHGGVWVIDVSTKARQAEPATLAAYQPHEPVEVVPSPGASSPYPMAPRVWGAGWDARGYLVVPDAMTGVYVLGPAWGLVPGIDSGQ